MKEGIHPAYRDVVFADLQTGKQFITRSTVQTRDTIEIDGKTIENAVWSYETPFPAMHAIKQYLAFYPNKVTIEELSA